MIEDAILALAFVLLLALEWRYRSRMLRVGAALLVLVVMVRTQPSARAAARVALDTPRSERVTELGGAASEYRSGVLTMENAVVDSRRANANARLLALGVLVWLACTPLMRQERRGPGEPA